MNGFPPLRAVIFDYGHTIVNFAPVEEPLLHVYEEVRRMLEAEAYRNLPQAPELVEAITRRVDAMVIESYHRQELEELDIVSLFDTALQGFGVTISREMVRQIAEMEHRAMLSELRASDANLDTLRQLKEMGLRIGLVSNAHFLPELMREDIERLGIAQYIDAAVFSAEIGVRKPHPAIYGKVLDALDIEGSEAVFVGDRLREDVGGPHELGMRAVLTHEFRQEVVVGSAYHPDVVITALPELVPWARERLKTLELK